MKNLQEQTKNLLKLRSYSPKTKKSYLLYITQYLDFFKENSSNSLIDEAQEIVEKFLLKKVRDGKSPQTVNLALNSIKGLSPNTRLS